MTMRRVILLSLLVCIVLMSMSCYNNKIAPIIPLSYADSTIPVGGTNLSISYKISNGNITGVVANEESSSLIISLHAVESGKLTVNLPRELINATKNNGSDDQFFVLLDGQDSSFTETSTTNTTRTLEIPFPAGTQQMIVIGTKVVPEFQSIAQVILIVATVSVIAVSLKSRILRS